MTISNKIYHIFISVLIVLSLLLIYTNSIDNLYAINNSTNIPKDFISITSKNLDLFSQVKDSVVRIDTLVQPINPKIQINNQPLTQSPVGSIGSGFIYDENGHIITNYHVIEGAKYVLVKFINGNSYTAQVIGSDPLNDIAVIQVDTSALQEEKIEPLPLANTSKLKIGSPVVAIGSPLGLTGSMTQGIISQINRIEHSIFHPMFWISGLIQTDAPITHGNSGGPLLNYEGEVVGISDRGVAHSRLGTAAEEPNIGLAISADTLKRIVPELISQGSYKHPYLGIYVSDIPSFFPQIVGVKDARGAYITFVEPASPAQIGGLEVNNILLKIDNINIKDKSDVINYLHSKSPSDTIKFKVLDNDGIVKDIVVKLTFLPVKISR
jgi:S1-C subfamily serine protease